MFAQPIWVFKALLRELNIARQSGWTWADWLWEQLMQRANEAYLSGSIAKAKRLFKCSLFIGHSCFKANDIRRATPLVNLAILALERGKTDKGRKQLLRGDEIWQQHMEGNVDAMQIQPRARSSLFHLRMESRHRQTYHNNLRTRFKRIGVETAEMIQTLPAKSPHRFYARWRGERPNIYDGTRKFLGAALLIIDIK